MQTNVTTVGAQTFTVAIWGGTAGDGTVSQANGRCVFSFEQMPTSSVSPLVGAMVGATSGAAGTAGYTTAPIAGQQGFFRRGDATWAANMPAFSGAVAYPANTVVSFNDAIWTNAADWAAGAFSTASWAPMVLGTGLTWLAAYNAGTSYAVGAVVADTAALGNLYESVAAANLGFAVTNWAKWRPISARLSKNIVPTPKITVYGATGPWNAAPGMVWMTVEEVGGGAGSGTSAGVAGFSASSAGGGAGAYVKAMLTAAQAGASQTVTIGAGGAGGAAGASNPGNNGLATTFGALLSAGGGIAGQASSGSSGLAFSVPGGAGGLPTVTTGTDMGSKSGGAGSFGIGNTPGGRSITGAGGDSALGVGGIAQVVNGNSAIAGGNAIGVGGGASGSGWNNVATNVGGGSGGSGKAIVIEYFQ